MIFDNASPGQRELSNVVFMSVREAYCDIYLLLMLLLIEAVSCLSQSHSMTDSLCGKKLCARESAPQPQLVVPVSPASLVISGIENGSTSTRCSRVVASPCHQIGKPCYSGRRQVRSIGKAMAEDLQ